jgi:hypothetical protein
MSPLGASHTAQARTSPPTYANPLRLSSEDRLAPGQETDEPLRFATAKGRGSLLRGAGTSKKSAAG